LGSNSKCAVKRTCFSSFVNPWRIQRKVVRIEPIRDIRVPTVSGEVNKVFAGVLKTFGFSWRINQIVACVSYRKSLGGRPSFRNSSLSRPTSLIRVNTEARPCAAESHTFQRGHKMSSLEHRSNRINLITAHHLPLTSTVVFRFRPFHKVTKACLVRLLLSKIGL
jgi:hypothetical protein